MNPLIKALKDSLTMRVSEAGRWLVWNESEKEWQVYRPCRAKSGQLVCSTGKLDVAVDFLLGKR